MKPIAQLVCHNCKRAYVSLLRIRDENGHKTPDYVCTKCVKDHPTPAVENISRRYIPEKPQVGDEDQKAKLGLLLPWIPVNKRALPPSDEEIQVNRRARSAKLRAAERSNLGFQELNQHKEVNSDLNAKKKKHMGLKQLRKLQAQQNVDTVQE